MEENIIDGSRKWSSVVQRMKAVEKYFNPDGTINATEIVKKNEIFISTYEKVINSISKGLRFEGFMYSLLLIGNSGMFGYTSMIPCNWLNIICLIIFFLCTLITFFKVVSINGKHGFIIAEKEKIKKFREQNNEKRILEVWEILKQKGI